MLVPEYQSGDVARQTAAWERYRRRRRAFVALWAGFAAMLLTLVVATPAGVSGAPLVLGAALGCVAIVLGVAYFRLDQFKCPRCGNPFFGDFDFNPPARRCANCRLPKLSVAEDE